MPMWLVSFILEKEESVLSELDIEASVIKMLIREFSKSRFKAKVRAMTVKRVE